MPSKKSRKQSGPMTAAGLISFYDEYEGRFKMSPTALIVFAAAYAMIIVIAHLIA